VETPKTHYVAVGEADVAYQVIGEGRQDLLYSYGLGAHLDVQWEDPRSSDFLKRLADLRRLIVFDRRGTGASDGVPRNAIPTWEEWTEDFLAVLDAASSRQAAIFASLDAGPIAILFAAAHPERVSALVLLTTTARYLADDDYPEGESPETVDAVVEMIESQWGSPELMKVVSPSMAEDREYLNFVAKMLRASATPRTAAGQFDYLLRNVDVRQALPLIQAPTLVLHASENPILPMAHGHYLADHIRGAKLVSLPGSDTGISLGNHGLIADEVAEFLTGQRPPVEIDRVLTTVLFSDIVGSTQRAASLGDRRWRSLLDDHNRVFREQLRLFHGKEIATTGDGFLASFDGPARAIRCSQSILEVTRPLGVDLRIGMHTGECEVRGEDLGGLAVHIVARVSALAGPGDVLVSGTVKDLVVGSGIEFEDRGDRELKGVPGTWKLLAVAS
jgi:class 3 adenylate cyclase